MKPGIYVCEDAVLLMQVASAARGESLSTLGADVIVYRGTDGSTGLDADELGRKILTWMLLDAWLWEEERMSPVELTTHEFPLALLRKSMRPQTTTIHSPDSRAVEIFAEGAAYAKHRKTNQLRSRYGLNVSEPDPPIIQQLASDDPHSRHGILAVLALHSGKVMLWCHSEYGLYPTVLDAKRRFRAELIEQCRMLGVYCRIVSSMDELPVW